MTACGDGIIAGTAEGRKAAIAQRCRRWDCEDCGPRKAAQLRARCYAARCNRGFDLTIKHLPERTLEEETELLKQCWRKFRIWWAKKHPNNIIHCISCWEVKGPRHVHLHCLARCGRVPQNILADFFWKEIQSHRQWIKYLKTKKDRIKYATKYITKGLVKLSHTHRYSTTHGFDDKSHKPPKDPFFLDMVWTPNIGTVVQFAHEQICKGWRVELDTQRGVAKARPP